jgi:hypothetical protein
MRPTVVYHASDHLCPPCRNRIVTIAHCYTPFFCLFFATRCLARMEHMLLKWCNAHVSMCASCLPLFSSISLHEMFALTHSRLQTYARGTGRYTLRHARGYSHSALRNWDLQVSVDGSEVGLWGSDADTAALFLCRHVHSVMTTTHRYNHCHRLEETPLHHHSTPLNATQPLPTTTTTTTTTTSHSLTHSPPPLTTISG